MRFRSIAVAAVAAGLVTTAVHAQAAGLQPGDRVAICGDSITEQHLYSADIEAYLILCKPVANVTAEQFGWGGETAAGFQQKMPQFMLPFGNTVATTCYGMNDGHYRAMSTQTGDAYRKSQTAVVQALKKAGYRFVVVGSPGAVDTKTYNRAPTAEGYNKTLAALGDIDREIAAQEGVGFADVHGVMVDVMAKAKAKYGDGYAVAGNDGVHPAANGHLVMAYAFLKALGVNGDVGTITVDVAAGTATATDGHKVVSAANGAIEMESTRYPFCFSGDPAKPDATAGVVEFFPFNDDLNRFKLVATHVGADRAKVTFGDATKEFAAADLAKGINLAAEFPTNPFSAPFAAEMKKIQLKQGIETQLDKNFYNSIPTYGQQVPEAKGAYEAVQPAIRDLLTAQAKALADGVQPVRYTVKVEPVK